MNPRIFGEIVKTNSIPSEQLHQCLQNAHAKFLATYNQIIAGKDIDTSITLQAYSVQLDAIAKISSQINLYGLLHICKELHHYLHTSVSGINEHQCMAHSLVVWVDDILVYLDNQNDLKGIQKLFNPLPKSNALFLKTVMEWQDDEAIAEINNNEADNIEFEADASFIEELIQAQSDKESEPQEPGEENDYDSPEQNSHHNLFDTVSVEDIEHTEAEFEQIFKSENASDAPLLSLTDVEQFLLGEKDDDLFQSDSEDEFNINTDKIFSAGNAEPDYARVDSEFQTMFNSNYQQTKESDTYAVLRQEITATTPDIIRLGQAICGPAPQQIHDQSILAYTILLKRLLLACESIELKDTNLINELILSNLNLESTVNAENGQPHALQLNNTYG